MAYDLDKDELYRRSPYGMNALADRLWEKHPMGAGGKAGRLDALFGMMGKYTDAAGRRL